MGHSCLEYKGRYKFIQDFEIEIVANTIINNIDEFISLYADTVEIEWMSNLKDKWKDNLKEPINGGINLHLDELLCEDERYEALLELIKFSKIKFLKGNSFLSNEEINKVFPYKIKIKTGGIKSKIIEKYFNTFSEFIKEA